MAYTKADLKEHFHAVILQKSREIEMLERKVKAANEALAVMASILSDKADEVANTYPDWNAAALHITGTDSN